MLAPVAVTLHLDQNARGATGEASDGNVVLGGGETKRRVVGQQYTWHISTTSPLGYREEACNRCNRLGARWKQRK